MDHQTDQHATPPTEPPAPGPARVVDRFGWGWCLQGGTHAYRRDLDDTGVGGRHDSHAALVAAGLEPRPVIAAPDNDTLTLEGALISAGKTAAASLFLGCARATAHVVAAHGGPRIHADHGYQHPMLGGRGGSWEAADFRHILAVYTLAEPANVPRADEVVTAVEAITHRWITDPAGYVECAATLADVMGRAMRTLGGELHHIAPRDQLNLVGGHLEHWLSGS